jgi:hypothetical protein
MAVPCIAIQISLPTKEAEFGRSLFGLIGDGSFLNICPEMNQKNMFHNYNGFEDNYLNHVHRFPMNTTKNFKTAIVWRVKPK